MTQHLGLHRLRLVIGNSMGGMETWILAQKYPALMDVAVPMAYTCCEPSALRPEATAVPAPPRLTHGETAAAATR